MLQIFNYRDKAKTVVAGSSVESGVMHTSGQERGLTYFRVKRKNEDGVYETILDNEHGAELKRFKDVVHEVKSGFECGFSIAKFKDFAVDDIIECVKVEYKSTPLHIERIGENRSNSLPEGSK